ncbi:MAG: hypothetical protein ABIT08_01150 [Bacteroidia bacterium]
MKLKIYLTIFIATSLVNNGTAQYFEWAHEFPISLKGSSAGNITTDQSGNVITFHQSLFCQVCSKSILTKTSPSGNVIYSVQGASTGNYFFGSVATDYAGNVYVTGNQFPGTFTIGSFSTSSMNWVFKVSHNGTVLWLRDLDNLYLMAVDSMGQLYLTNNAIHNTFKVRVDNTIAWSDSTRGGTDIGVDGRHRCYILNDTSITRYNQTGLLSYHKSFGGNRLSVNKHGTAFILSSTGLTKLKHSGKIGWSNSFITGNAIASNDDHVYVASGAQLSKWKFDGTFEWSFFSGGAPLTNIAIDQNNNVYADGNYDMIVNPVLCPFKLADLNSPIYSNFQSFVAKISGNAPIPYQIGIFTGDLFATYGNVLCKNTPLSNIPFTYCLNSTSTLDPSNEFRIQISPDNFTSIIYDIGTAASVNIPGSVPDGPNYRLRVVATVPAVNGYPNSTSGPTTNITIHDNATTVTASGPLTFCDGDSVKLTAIFQPYTINVSWYDGANFISSDTSITVTSSGNYVCHFFNSCMGESAPYSVVVLSKPSAGITPGGPVTFCAGGSVVLTANSGAGYTYHWRKNGSVISGATNINYTATTAGDYAVKVINPGGCAKFSSPVTVTVPCRQSGDKISNEGFVKIFPQPVHDVMNIDIQNFQGSGMLYLINALGQTVIVKEMDFHDSGLKSIDMKKYPAGVYSVIVNGLEKREVVRVVKE